MLGRDSKINFDFRNGPHFFQLCNPISDAIPRGEHVIRKQPTPRETVTFRWPAVPGTRWNGNVVQGLAGRRVRYQGVPATVTAVRVVEEGLAIMVTVEGPRVATAFWEAWEQAIKGEST
jgi:hypothetical protein